MISVTLLFTLSPLFASSLLFPFIFVPLFWDLASVSSDIFVAQPGEVLEEDPVCYVLYVYPLVWLENEVAEKATGFCSRV
ncbi:hypothetical protein BDY21DRAFT_342955 [Lineolata rhizophorae]|uniref:Uncharacterized protein n=1 Tax=Lineolata rhizophorae TaxID=578093 RepID=A0A6A6P1D8_9PEZI|nr:hypothetical protein BDY21DRAFT_342955 [Lineolata rhizophorae]